jgi:hypothetical protein
MAILRHFIFAWILCLSLVGWGQNLTQVRVYFDGIDEEAQYFNVASLSALDQPFTVNLENVELGVHTMYVEVMDNNGRWSLYDHDNIQVWGGLQMAVLNACEYFFNTDPGWGEGIQIPMNANNVNESFDLNLSGLPNGVHIAYIRVRDGANQWSLYAERVFQVVGSMHEELVEAEYFFNSDPGLGNANPLALSELAFDGNLELSLEGLMNGVHTLYVRVKDARGIWSLYSQHNVVITNPTSGTTLVAAEYFFDTDPGIGNATALLIPQSSVVDGNFPITLPPNMIGTHSICIRVMDINNQWSPTVCQTITICNAQAPQITASSQYCQSNPLVLTASAGYDSYTWSNGLTGASISVTEPGTYTVNVTDNGCAATASIDAQFQYNPPVVFTTEGSTCQGDVQTISIADADVYDNIVWQNGQTSPFIAVSTSGIYEVTVTSGTCTSSYSTNVSFYEPIAPTIVTTGSSCEGELLTLSVWSGYTNVSWSNSSEGNSTIVSQNGNYTVQALDQGCVVEGSIDVVFYAAPQFEITQTGGACEGDEVILSVPAGFDAYQWTEGSQSETQTIFESGNYAVTVYNGNCSVVQSILVDLSQPIVPSIIQNGNVMACDISGADYQWYLNGVAISGANAQFYTATASGFYTVQATVAGCPALSSILNFNFTGISSPINEHFHVFPIPTRDDVYCHGEWITTLELYDMTGRLLKQMNVNARSATLSLADLATGPYILSATFSEGRKELIRLEKM